MEVNDIVLFDHQLLLNRSNDIDYKEGIIKSTISLMNFLQKNDLLIDIDPFNKDILLSSKYKYMEAFMVSENLKEKILEMFSLPFLYTLKEWKEQNDYEIIGFDKLDEL